jgi:hypothetical protein
MSVKKQNGRSICAAFDQDEVHVLATAAKAYAAMLNVHDGRHPDPEIRNDAAVLEELAKDLLAANTVRLFIEEAS